MMLPWLMALAVSVSAAPSMPAQRMRTEALDPATKTHMVHVVGFPGMITTIQLPDSFEDRNVLCGECIEIQSGTQESEAPKRGSDARKWIIEKHAPERSIHLRPAKLPTSGNPVSAFSTNVFVTLDGGHAINISLTLYGAKATGQPAIQGADAVVTLTLPGQSGLSGRLQQAEEELTKTHTASVSEAAHTLLLKRLLGDVECRKTRWPKPYRTDKTVVRVAQICRSQAEHPSVWVVFDIENRGDTPLHIERVSLEPEAREDVVTDPVSYFVETTDMSFAEHTKGVVSVSLKPGTPFPESWRLQITPASSERQPVTVAPVTF